MLVGCGDGSCADIQRVVLTTGPRSALAATLCASKEVVVGVGVVREIPEAPTAPPLDFEKKRMLASARTHTNIMAAAILSTPKTLILQRTARCGGASSSPLLLPLHSFKILVLLVSIPGLVNISLPAGYPRLFGAQSASIFL